MEELNGFGQPVGHRVACDLPRPRPGRRSLTGRFIRVAPMVIEHAEGLFERVGGADRAPLWTYMPVGPFAGFEAFYHWCERICDGPDPLMFTIEDRNTHRPLGFAAYLCVAPDAARLEIGYILFSKALQCTPGATEAMALMMTHAFDDLGYRRCEWKCDALNAPSRRAAARLGFVFEGVFRQHAVVKGRNRDTAWFSVRDGDWPRLRAGFESWLAPRNFDDNGSQRQSLAACRGD